MAIIEVWVNQTVLPGLRTVSLFLNTYFNLEIYKDKKNSPPPPEVSLENLRKVDFEYIFVTYYLLHLWNRH